MTEKTTSTNPLDIFIVGVRKGINIALLNLTPNVLMVYKNHLSDMIYK